MLRAPQWGSFSPTNLVTLYNTYHTAVYNELHFLYTMIQQFLLDCYQKNTKSDKITFSSTLMGTMVLNDEQIQKLWHFDMFC